MASRQKRTLRTNNEWVHAQPSGIHGQGLFARKDIPAGIAIVEYRGPRLGVKEGKCLAADGNVYMFRANRREFIDGSVVWNLARHANHSCAPNAVSLNIYGGIWLQALRPILRGEEITYNYRYSLRDEPTACHCGAPHCAGVIAA